MVASLLGGPITLIRGHISCSSGSGGLLLISLSGLVNDAHHRLFERLAFKIQTVLVPDEIRSADVEIVALHAALEK